MEYGSFWGITVPNLILLDLNNKDFAKYVELLNNSRDSYRLKNLKEELQMCCRFLDSKIIMDYSDPEYKKKERSLKLSKEHYATGKPVAKSRLIPKEEIPVVEELLNSTPKDTMSPFVMNNGIRYDLSESAMKILTFFKSQRFTFDRYLNGIKVNSFKERTIFGENLNHFLHRNGRTLKERVVRIIAGSKTDKRLLDKALESIGSDLIVLTDIAASSILGSAEQTTNVLKFNAQGKLEGGTGFTLHQTEFLKYLDELKLLNGFTNDQLKPLAQLYDKVCELNLSVFNSLFGLNLTQKEMEDVFQELDDIGFVGLNFESKPFYLNSFLNAMIGSKYVAKIPKDSSLIPAIFEVNRLLDTQKKFGEVLN